MTAPTEDLIARLNEQFGDPETGGFEYVNPDGPAAAQALRALQQENDDLRKKHGDIIFLRKDDPGHSEQYYADRTSEIARSALTGSAQG